MKNLIQKFLNKETISYLVFGVLTTIVNIIVFDVCNQVMHYLVADVIAWILAVVFAYITNKLFVFESKSFAKDVLKKEISAFLFARIVSLLVDLAIMFISVDLLHMNELLAKIISQVFIVVINYVFSKLVIFKK